MDGVILGHKGGGGVPPDGLCLNTYKISKQFFYFFLFFTPPFLCEKAGHMYGWNKWGLEILRPLLQGDENLLLKTQFRQFFFLLA